MEQQFVSILKGTLVMPWFWLGVAPLAFLICNYIAYRRAKAKKKTKKMAARRKDIKKGIVFVVIALVLVTITTVDVVKDMNNQSFCTVHGDFEKGIPREHGAQAAMPIIQSSLMTARNFSSICRRCAGRLKSPTCPKTERITARCGTAKIRTMR